MKNVAVIGAGTMGNGIAHTFAQSGFKVQLIDINEASLKRGVETISKNLDRMVAKEKISEADKTETLENITVYTNITEGVECEDLGTSILCTCSLGYSSTMNTSCSKCPAGKYSDSYSVGDTNETKCTSPCWRMNT